MKQAPDPWTIAVANSTIIRTAKLTGLGSNDGVDASNFVSDFPGAFEIPGVVGGRREPAVHFLLIFGLLQSRV